MVVYPELQKRKNFHLHNCGKKLFVIIHFPKYHYLYIATT